MIGMHGASYIVGMSGNGLQTATWGLHSLVPFPGVNLRPGLRSPRCSNYPHTIQSELRCWDLLSWPLRVWRLSISRRRKFFLVRLQNLQ